MAASQVRACIDRKVEQLWRSEHHDHDGPAPRGALSDERLRAQAMIELIRSGHAAPDGTRAPAEVLVLIDYQTLLGQLSLAGRCELGDGTPLPASEVRRLACEARIIPVLMGGGSLPLDVGRSRRLATGAERAGARAVHDTCCIDGCDTTFDYCELHHIRWWGNGGRSDLANLAPVCSKHHHLIHDHGWELRLDRQRLGTLTSVSSRHGPVALGAATGGLRCALSGRGSTSRLGSVPEQLLIVLKFCLLALVYVFFFRVLRAVWAQLREPEMAAATPTAPPVAAPPAAATPAPAKSKRRGVPTAVSLVVREPKGLAGTAYTLTDELTIGRAPGCHITLDDTYVSQVHARVFVRDGKVMIEDLGSTNGTYHNRAKVGAPVIVNQGDRVQAGGVVMELV